jgi:hypothetical protein
MKFAQYKKIRDLEDSISLDSDNLIILDDLIEVESAERELLEFDLTSISDEVDRARVDGYDDIPDGYLGEYLDVPNPLESGPNSMYRNPREGIVYRKNISNLWEVFLKDGVTNNKQTVGSGLGRQEIIELISQYLNDITIVDIA